MNNSLLLRVFKEDTADALNFASAYGKYRRKITRLNRASVYGCDEDYDASLRGLVSAAAVSVFNLNRFAQEHYGRTFLNGFVDNEEKENLINEVYEVIVPPDC